ncbi:MAG TPA: hypothetical protein VN380_16370 [Thermoanaerobaculia bacterium]|nr:hypothetical protein [Thermoanaerobaculia bacterium]
MDSLRSMLSVAAVSCVIPVLSASAITGKPLPHRLPAVVPAIALTALRDSNETNDFRRFEGALAVAKSLADLMPLGAERNALRRAILVYEDVDAVWSFAVRDRYGAYFNDDSLPGLHDRLTADYPGYDDFIADYRVADRKGNVLYPTAETRTFLLKQIAP